MSNNHDLHDERISKLYKMGEQSEPPEHIDNEIKRSAHAASSTRKKSYVWPSLATAAVLVLSFSLVLKVLEQKPLEESVMEPMRTKDSAITTVDMLQESEEKAAVRSDKEEPKPQRYRAIKQKVAPVPAKPKTESAVHFEAAPAMVDELKSSTTPPLDCSGLTLPVTDSSDEWIKQYQKALKLGQLKTARCLKQAYRSRFNQSMPEP